jgi:hypothetical protein
VVSKKRWESEKKEKKERGKKRGQERIENLRKKIFIEEG